MPMVKSDDFGNNDPKNVLCKHCFSDKSSVVPENAEKIDDDMEINDVEDLDKIDKMGLF